MRNPADTVASAADDARAPAGAIILARHGRPALDRSQAVSWRGFRDWWRAYDDGGLAPGQTPPAELVEIGRTADIVFASGLTRSVETAAAVAPGRDVIVDRRFIEAALPPPALPGVRLKPPAWAAVARISWWLGWTRGAESRVLAERRADAAADFLIGQAEGGRSVLVCAHGWFNRMLRPALLARGWRCVQDGRDRYWSHRRFERAGG